VQQPGSGCNRVWGLSAVWFGCSGGWALGAAVSRVWVQWGLGSGCIRGWGLGSGCSGVWVQWGLGSGYKGVWALGAAARLWVQRGLGSGCSGVWGLGAVGFEVWVQQPGFGYHSSQAVGTAAAGVWVQPPGNPPPPLQVTEISNIKCVTRLPKETKRQAVAIVFTDDSARTFTCDSGTGQGSGAGGAAVGAPRFGRGLAGAAMVPCRAGGGGVVQDAVGGMPGRPPERRRPRGPRPAGARRSVRADG